MKKIPLHGKYGEGQFALVDDDIFERYGHIRWHLVPKPGGGCAIRHNINEGGGKYRMLNLHRVVLNAPEGQEVDHVDNDGKNNTRENLRLCLHKENSRNRRKPSTNTSGYKGVYRSRTVQEKWDAKIRIDDVLISLGSYQTREEAAQAYNIAARKYHGAFARLNEIAWPHTASTTPPQKFRFGAASGRPHM